MTYIPQQELARSAFGDTITAPLKGIVTAKAVYGINDELTQITAGSASISAANSEFCVATGATANSQAVLWSQRPVVYSPGIGFEARITARFPTGGVANSRQGAGAINGSDGLMFGFEGTSFGIIHMHHGAIEIRTITVTAGASGAETATITLNGVAYTVSLTAGATTHNAHELEALAATAAGSLWQFQHIGSTLVCVSRSQGAKSGTYSFSSTGTATATIAATQSGVTPTFDFTARASWNKDTCSWLDTTKGNLYKVEFAYLGYGPLKYSVFNPNTNEWVLAHVVNWANANTQTNLGNPSLRIGWYATSLGSTTNIQVYGASGMAGLQGDPVGGRTFGAYGIATSVTTETQVLTVAARREFGSKTNIGALKPTILNISTDSTKGAVFKVYRNAVLNGTTTLTYVDQTQSCALYDTGATTVATAGDIVGVFSVGPAGRASINLSDIDSDITAGDTLDITALVTSGAGSEMTAAVTWEEIL